MTEPLRDDATDAVSAAGGYAEPDAPSPGLPHPSAVESLVSSLLEAGPEVAEHVVRAAQELLLAAQVIVDAAERAVQEQQALRDQTQADESGAIPKNQTPNNQTANHQGDDQHAAEETATVHHLDLAE